MIEDSPGLKMLKPHTKYIPDQVWVSILRHFQDPTPAPLSCPPRSALKQPYLCSAMLVCKSFHAICAPLLYTHIITDNFAHLLAFTEIPTSPNFPNKRSHRLRTQTLLIEYTKKGDHSTYPELLAGFKSAERWLMVGVRPEHLKYLEYGQCEMELDQLDACMSWLGDFPMADFWPSLTSVGVGSFYGAKTSAGWVQFMDHQFQPCTGDCRTGVVGRTAKAFHKFIDSGNLRHFCLRDIVGPLSLGEHVEVGQPHHTTIHFGTDVGKLPLPSFTPGSSTHWTYDGPSDAKWSPLIGAVASNFTDSHANTTSLSHYDLTISCSTNMLGTCNFDAKRALCNVAHQTVPSTGSSGAFPPDRPTAILSPNLQNSMAAELEGEVREALKVNVQRKISWRSSQNSPTCEACGWMPAV